MDVRLGGIVLVAWLGIAMGRLLIHIAPEERIPLARAITWFRNLLLVLIGVLLTLPDPQLYVWIALVIVGSGLVLERRRIPALSLLFGIILALQQESAYFPYLALAIFAYGLCEGSLNLAPKKAKKEEEIPLQKRLPEVILGMGMMLLQSLLLPVAFVFLTLFG